jgi:hypothetical protein
MPRKHEKMRRVQHYVTQQQAEKLEFLSEEQGFGISEHMRRALEAYFALPYIRTALKAKQGAIAKEVI